MLHPLFRYFSGFFALSLLVAVPQVGFAATKKPAKKVQSFQQMMYNPNKTYKDEKVVINNPTTRCVTATTKAAHAKSLATAKTDGVKFNVTTSTASTHGEAFRAYVGDLDLAWGAMLEPYCGFGSFGLTAANKSYTKSVTRARDRFLEAVKKPSKPKAFVVESTSSTMVTVVPMAEPVVTSSSASFVVSATTTLSTTTMTTLPSDEPVVSSSTIFFAPVSVTPAVVTQIVTASAVPVGPNIYPELWSF